MRSRECATPIAWSVHATVHTRWNTPSGPRRMLGSRMSAAVVFHSFQPRPEPVIAGWMTERPPLSGSHVTPSRLYARWTPSSPLRVKYENKNALRSGRGDGAAEWPPQPSSDRAATNSAARRLVVRTLRLAIRRRHGGPALH